MKKRYVTVGPGTRIARLGGRPPRATQVLLILQVGLFIAYAFADGPKWVAAYLGASAAQTLGLFQLWQPLTALWIHLSSGGLLFNALSLWIFGSALERWWGSRRFVLFWVVTGAVGLFMGVLVGMVQPQAVLSGSGGAAAAMLVATAVIFADHLTYFFGLLNLKLKHLAPILLGFAVIGDVLAGAYLNIAVLAGGAGAALLFLFRPRRLIGQARVRRAKRKLNVIEGGRKKDEKKYLN